MSLRFYIAFVCGECEYLCSRKESVLTEVFGILPIMEGYSVVVFVSDLSTPRQVLDTLTFHNSVIVYVVALDSRVGSFLDLTYDVKCEFCTPWEPLREFNLLDVLLVSRKAIDVVNVEELNISDDIYEFYRYLESMGLRDAYIRFQKIISPQDRLKLGLLEMTTYVRAVDLYLPKILQ